eukprot:421688_1
MVYAIALAFIIAFVMVHSQVTITSYNNASCGNSLAQYINVGEIHSYQLTLDKTSVVTLSSCSSKTDIVIVVNDAYNNDISDEWCSRGDWCGSCSFEDKYSEYFTIPSMIPGTYYIQIETYFLGDPGNYQVDISCAVNNDSTSLSPTTYYTTSSVPSDCIGKFLCHKSGICIPTSKICDSIVDCPNSEDEFDSCRICFGDLHGLFGGAFEFFSYNVDTESIIYKNSVNNYYLYPSDNYYVIGPDLNESSYYEFCFLSGTSNLKVENCIGWTDGISLFDNSVFVDIGCMGCHYICAQSRICINNGMLCDGKSDCYLNDDEDNCNVCIDSEMDDYSYFSGQYSYFGYDNTYKGKIYFDDSYEWSFGPIILDFGNIYLYSYVITSNQSDVVVFCGVGTYPELLPYFVIDIELCNFWFTYLESGDLLFLNITTEYCKANVSDTHSHPPTHESKNLFVIPRWIDPNNSSSNTVTFYVASDGFDHTHCGSEHDPCGTLFMTAQVASFVANNIEHITSITVVIRGQNRETILFSNGYLQFNPCYGMFQFSIDLNKTLSFSKISYVFDVDYVRSLNDWFPIFPSSQKLCQYHDNLSFAEKSFFQITQVETFNEHLQVINYAVVDFTVEFHNLIITDWTVTNQDTKLSSITGMPYDGYLNINYIFQNLTFVNNIISPHYVTSLVQAPSIEIYQSTISNNVLTGNLHSIFSTDINDIDLPDSKQTRFVMKDNLVSNNTFFNSVIFADIVSEYAELFVEIVNNTFENINLDEMSVIFRIRDITKSNYIIIQNLIVHGIDNTIIQASDVNSGIFVIKHVDIETTKMHEKESTALFLIVSENSVINISNVNITYLIANQLVSHCWMSQAVNDQCYFSEGVVFTVVTPPNYYNQNAGIWYQCYTPILFIYSQSDDLTNLVKISEIAVYNDITKKSLTLVKNKLFEQTEWKCNITENVPATIKYSVRESSITSGFITINGGHVKLDGLYMYGAGPSSEMIVLRSVASEYFVEIENMNSYYNEYCGDMICPFDAYALHINIFVSNRGFGTTHLSNSNFYGSAMGFLHIGYGNYYILNSSMEYGYSVIQIINPVATLHIIDSQFINVGQYYVLPLFGLDMLSTFSIDHWMQRTPPLILSGSNILIQNCYFNTNHAAGILLFSASWPSTTKSSYAPSNVIFINNTIERNSDPIVYNISRMPYQAKGIINIVGNVQMYVIGNTMIESSVQKDNKALLYIESQQSVCFSGNNFTASTIINVAPENSESITSCFRYNIQDIFQHINYCYYGTLGKTAYALEYEVFSESSPMDYWTAVNPNIAIIQASGSNIMLDNITFTTTFDASYYAAIEMVEGELVLLDAIINQSFIGFGIDFSTCKIICFNLLQNYHNKEQLYISQFHANCSKIDKNIPNNLQFISMNESKWINHTTPYYIYFTYDQEYVVDSSLELSFYITDQFTNIINDYSSLLSIEFFNAVLQIDDVHVINPYDSMVLNPIVTNERAFENFTIKAVVNNNELIVPDDIQITVFPRDYSKEIINQDLLWLIALLAIPCCIVIVCCIWCKKEYNKAFVVNKVLVLLIGISQFDDRQLLLPGVRYAIDKLSQLWKGVYNYDMFVCKEETLDATKEDVINFIDKYKKMLDNIETTQQYSGVIVHIISHGSETDSFITSDLQHMKPSGFIQHEITSEIEMRDKSENSDVVKLIFHHQCRGTAIFHTGKLKHRTTDTIQSEMQPIKKSEEKFEEDTGSNNGQEEKNANSNNGDEMFSDDANWITIYGTIDGRAMSDKGNFSDCIYESFDKNIKRNWSLKKDLIQLVTEIGQNLERQTRSAEICTIKSNLRYEKIRFEPSKKQIEPINSLDDHDETMPLSDNEFSDNLYDMNSIELVQVTHHEEKDNNDVAIEEDEDDEKKVLVNKQTDRKDCTSKQILHK